MDSVSRREKCLSAISYIGWVLILIVGICNTDDRKSEYVSHHLKQAIVLNAIATLSMILQEFALTKTLGGIIAPVTLVFLVWGVVYALTGNTKDIPVLNLQPLPPGKPTALAVG